MGSLSDIVNVTVTTQTAAIKQAGFGIPLVIGFHTRFAERARVYSSPAAMLADGFTANDAEYKAVGQIFAQNPQPEYVVVGRKTNAPDLQIDLTPTAINSKLYKVELVGPAGLTATPSYTSDATATVAEIVAGLVSAINTAALGITATDQTTFVRLKASSAGTFFSANSLDRSALQCKQTHANPGIAADLDAVKLENNDWYGVESTSASAAEVAALATWVETNKKFSCQSTQDSDCVGSGSGDVMSTVKTANQFRTGLFFHPDNSKFIGAAVLGKCLPAAPGSITFKFKQLAGVPSVALTDTELGFLRSKKGNSVTTFGGIAMTLEGTAASGEFLDVTRDRDWMENIIQTGVFNLMVNNSGKLPFTDAGIAAVKGVLRACLDQGVAAGFLAATPEPTVQAPRASQVSAQDKASRTLNGVTGSAVIAGAIHKAVLNVSITL